MTKDEAMKLALEALEAALSDDQPYLRRSEKAVEAIRQALAEPSAPPKFPTALRKMWSGTEVQEWINENWSKQ